MTNAIKHAGARHIEVRLAGTHADLRFAVVDDGRGFDTTAAQPAGGLANITARLAALGGELHVRSDRSGTQVSGRVPA